MTSKTANKPFIDINPQRLKHFFVRLIAGIGVFNIWIVLLLASGTTTAYTMIKLSNLSGIEYIAGLAFIPAAIFCWFVCYFLSLEFLSEIGVELNGIARYIVVPVAVPLAAFSFILSLLVSAGESISNKRLLVFSFLLGAGIFAAIVSVFL